MDDGGKKRSKIDITKVSLPILWKHLSIKLYNLTTPPPPPSAPTPAPAGINHSSSLISPSTWLLIGRLVRWETQHECNPFLVPRSSSRRRSSRPATSIKEKVTNFCFSHVDSHSRHALNAVMILFRISYIMFTLLLLFLGEEFLSWRRVESF